MAAPRVFLLLVLAGFVAVAGVFFFARPHQPHQGRLLSFERYHAPARGWTWAEGQPGFRFGKDEQDWNLAHVTRAELPAGVLPLHAVRLAPHELYALVSGSDAQGRTCLGAVLPRKPVESFCPSASGAHRLGPQLALVVVAARPSFQARFGSRHLTEFPLFLIGANRADVTRVVVSAPGLKPQAFYQRAAGWWGTFDGTPGDGYLTGHVPKHPWRARLDFFGAYGRLASLQVRLDRPTAQVFAVPAP